MTTVSDEELYAAIYGAIWDMVVIAECETEDIVNAAVFAVRKALTAAPVPPVVPDGWQLLRLESNAFSVDGDTYPDYVATLGSEWHGSVYGKGDTWQEALQAACDAAKAGGDNAEAKG